MAILYLIYLQNISYIFHLSILFFLFCKTICQQLTTNIVASTNKIIVVKTLNTN